MAFQFSGLLERRGLSRMLRRWSSLAERAPQLTARELRTLHQQASAARTEMGRICLATETALMTAGMSADGIDRPEQCDWAFRPAPWVEPMETRGMVSVPSATLLNGGVKIFHDAGNSELTYRQVRNTDAEIAAPYALQLDVYRFDGSFVSLVQDLPADALRGLTKDHFIKVALRLSLEQPLEVYARLNVQHGPNMEQMVRQFAFERGVAVAEFDLAYSKINEKRLEKIWLDLIFEGPKMNQVVVRDMTMTRAPRADL